MQSCVAVVNIVDEYTPFTEGDFRAKIDIIWAGVTQRKSACFLSKLPALKARRTRTRYGIHLPKQALFCIWLMWVEFPGYSIHFWISLYCSCSRSIFSVIASSSHCPKHLPVYLGGDTDSVVKTLAIIYICPIIYWAMIFELTSSIPSRQLNIHYFTSIAKVRCSRMLSIIHLDVTR